MKDTTGKTSGQVKNKSIGAGAKMRTTTGQYGTGIPKGGAKGGYARGNTGGPTKGRKAK